MGDKVVALVRCSPVLGARQETRRDAKTCSMKHKEDPGPRVGRNSIEKKDTYEDWSGVKTWWSNVGSLPSRPYQRDNRQPCAAAVGSTPYDRSPMQYVARKSDTDPTSVSSFGILSSGSMAMACRVQKKGIATRSIDVPVVAKAIPSRPILCHDSMVRLPSKIHPSKPREERRNRRFDRGHPKPPPGPGLRARWAWIEGARSY